MENIEKRNNIKVIGTGNTTIMLAHGFGCDQNMWRLLIPYLKDDCKLVLFDYVGSGNSIKQSFNLERYSDLYGYAKDVNEIIDYLNLTKVHFIGHSVSAMIGLIAQINTPDKFSSLTMVCPSPCFLNKPPSYIGGFEAEDLEELLSLMDKNYMGWANYLSPLVMGATNSKELIDELSNSFCSTDPLMAKQFARATFFGDYRHLLSKSACKTLILQSENDNLASLEIGHYIDNEMQNSELKIIDADGHCLHMTHPSVISPLIHTFVKE